VDHRVKANDPSWREPAGEEGVSREMLEIRAALLRLPKATCPVGFEYRLQRRIEGTSSARPVTTGLRGWSLAWAGVGLGLAASVVVATIAFDFHFNAAGGVSAPVANTVTTNAVPSVYGPPLLMVSEPAHAQGLEADQPSQMANSAPARQSEKDSLKPKNPAELPSEGYQQVNFRVHH